jgi:AcrR family transcriptional regulator
MGRRSDHSRTELRDLIVEAGHRQMEEVGFAHFSAREVAKRIGYSVGTIYNVFGTYDGLITAINGRTLELWRDYLESRLDEKTSDRLKRAIDAYFEFAVVHRNAWAALFDFRLPDDVEPSADYLDRVGAIVEIVVREVAAALPPHRAAEAEPLARSLLATVHGHCFFTLNGTFRILGEQDPLTSALERVADTLARRT